MRGHGPSADRPRYPEYRETVGEDPARFLTLGSDIAVPRIRGIDRLDVLDAWVRVAHDLDAGDDVLEELRLRASYLNRHGERPAELPAEDGPRRYRPREVLVEDDSGDDEPVGRVHEACGSEVRERSDYTWYCPDCDTVTNQVEEATANV